MYLMHLFIYLVFYLASAGGAPGVATCYDCYTKDCNSVIGTDLCRTGWVKNACPVTCEECGIFILEHKHPVCHVDKRVCEKIDVRYCHVGLVQRACGDRCGKTTTRVPSETRTPKPPMPAPTKPPKVKRTCHVCEDPFCDIGFEAIQECADWKPFCMNFLEIDNTGKRTMKKRCVSEVECDYEWLNRTSQRDECRYFDDDKIYTSPLKCQFCCQADNCNRNTVPHVDTLKLNKHKDDTA